MADGGDNLLRWHSRYGLRILLYVTSINADSWSVAGVHSGIGGGGLMLIRSPNGSYEYVDFREAAPAAAHEGMYKNRLNSSVFGGLAR